MESKAAFSLEDLCFAYAQKPVLRHLSLSIKKGEITTIMGSNGCGKSTLLQLLSKNLKPNLGKISAFGVDIENVTMKEFAKQVAIVHQYNTAPDDLTVDELVKYGRTPYQKFNQSTKQKEADVLKVEHAMKITGVTRFREQAIGKLSGGQKQRVWIAMALAQDTKVLLLDEPTTYLDVRYQLQILRLVRALNEKYSMTIIMVLHDINQALSYSHDIIALSPNGTLLAQGTPKDVVNEQILSDMYEVNLKIQTINDNPFVITV